MKFENLLVSMTNRIATVTINRPKVLNSLNKDTLLEIKSAFETLGQDKDVKVVFSPAAEKRLLWRVRISPFMQPLNAVQGLEFARLGQLAFMAIENCPKP